MQRREFLVASGQAVAFAFSTRATHSKALSSDQEPSRSEDTVEQRVSAIIQAYDAQGNHRTGTEVDRLSAEWLAAEVRRLGLEPSLESFTLDRVDPQTCYLRVGERRIDGVPLFDGSFTDGQGVRGKLGPLGSSAEIGLIDIGPFKLEAPRAEHEGPISSARRGTHKGLVIVTRARRPGLFLSNALAFRNPSGPPMLQVSNTESEWLMEQSRKGTEATLVAHVTRTTAQAFNVTVKIPGRNPNLPPLVFMAPHSAWWQCVTEQGCRLAVWLETMRSLATGHRPARDCFFVALSGHELGVLGMDGYLKSRPDLIRRAHAWIFFGSCIGTPHQPNLIHTSDDELEQWIVAAMKAEGLTVDQRAPHDSPARGEAVVVQRGGGRFVTIACDSDVYHSVADRWPEAVDVALLSRYATALATAAIKLAEQGG